MQRPRRGTRTRSTGSTRSAPRSPKAAGQQHHRGCCSSCGRKSAHRVLPDADLDAASNAGWWPGWSRRPARPAWRGPGSLVHGACTTRTVSKIVARRRTAIKLGDPRGGRDRDGGPLATEPQYQKSAFLFASAAQRGADLATGGHRHAGHLGGLLVEHTVKSTKASTAGPCPSKGGVRPGDGGSLSRHERGGHQPGQRHPTTAWPRAVWTKDIHRGHRVAHDAEDRTVWINALTGWSARTRPVRGVRTGQRARPGKRDRGGSTVKPDQSHSGVFELTGGTRDQLTGLE